MRARGEKTIRCEKGMVVVFRKKGLSLKGIGKTISRREMGDSFIRMGTHMKAPFRKERRRDLANIEIAQDVHLRVNGKTTFNTASAPRLDLEGIHTREIISKV
jgi:hypothetical protein